MSIKTLVGAAEPERPPNEPATWTNGTTTSTNTAAWLRLDVKR